MSHNPISSPARAVRASFWCVVALTVLALWGCAAAPPPPPANETTVVVERPPKPHPHAVWVQGHYVYHQGRYHWVPGHWSRR